MPLHRATSSSLLLYLVLPLPSRCDVASTSTVPVLDTVLANSIWHPDFIHSTGTLYLIWHPVLTTSQTDTHIQCVRSGYARPLLANTLPLTQHDFRMSHLAKNKTSGNQARERNEIAQTISGDMACFHISHHRSMGKRLHGVAAVHVLSDFSLTDACFTVMCTEHHHSLHQNGYESKHPVRIAPR